MKDETSQREWRETQWRMLGNWEPKMFLYRRGDAAFVDVERLWAEGHGPHAIARMQDLGVNVSHIHFHKGYGLQHERRSIDEAAAWARELHEAGIKVGVYIGCTLFTETFDPRLLEQMAAVGSTGGWSGAQYFRRFWCWNNPHAIEYFNEVIRVAIETVGGDVLHFDSGFAYSHDQLCHCEHCLSAFKTFVEDEIPEILNASGYVDARHLSAPPTGNLEYLSTVHEMREPGDIAWTLFHAQAGTKVLRRLGDFARQLSPDVGIFYNGANLAGITPYGRPNMEIQALGCVDATAVEDDRENPVGVTDDGAPISRFRVYKAAARRGTRVYYYTCGDKYDARILLGEAAAFNHACLGMIELAMQVNRRIKNRRELDFLNYLVANESLFLARSQWHSIGVVRHHESMLLNPYPSSLTPYVVEQMLFERHFSFGILGGDELQHGQRLSDFEGLILPDSKCLSDAEAANVARFVEQGGWLLSIGNSGTATPLNQFRGHWALAPIFGGDNTVASRASYEEVASASDVMRGDDRQATVRATFGHGHALQIPGLDFDLPDDSKLNRFAGFPWYYHPYWRHPLNADMFFAALSELQSCGPRIATDLPRHVGMECYRVSNGHRFHFVSFDAQKTVEPFTLSIRLDDPSRTTSRVLWQTPAADRRLDVAVDGGRVKIKCPEFDVLATLTLELE